jgi:hypothetical protein
MICSWFKKKYPPLRVVVPEVIPLELDKSSLLVHEAKRWLKFTEEGGDNKDDF